MEKNKLVVIVGPTAIGKTSISIELAKKFDSQIVSCDSRQFYAQMSIGTAVPSSIELCQVPHHFIQNKSIFENYTVGDYEKEAITKFEALFKTNPYAILVGGSGLYVEAVLKGFDQFPEIDNTVREQVLSYFDKFGIVYLQQKLNELDAYYFNKLSTENPQTLQNPQRMMRFLEVCIGTGKPYSSFLNKDKAKRNFTPILIGLKADRAVLYDRINLRVDKMMEAGLLSEAEKLYEYKNLNALQTVGYKELFEYLENKTTLELAIEAIKQNTRRFAKRQLTWFKRNHDINWFDSNTPIEELESFINSKQ